MTTPSAPPRQRPGPKPRPFAMSADGHLADEVFERGLPALVELLELGVTGALASGALVQVETGEAIFICCADEAEEILRANHAANSVA
jgi:hypothetical protein